MKKEPFVLDLWTTDVGMTCEEYSALMIAGLGNELPEVTRRMNKHADVCAYHKSSAFFESAVDAYVTPAVEEYARQIIEKYKNK